jgi:hypothetical protein
MSLVKLVSLFYHFLQFVLHFASYQQKNKIKPVNETRPKPARVGPNPRRSRAHPRPRTTLH